VDWLVIAIGGPEGTMEMLLVVIGLLALGLAAHRWGVDSTDGPDSPEWARRRTWPGHTDTDAE
jgi:hypothetical protein